MRLYELDIKSLWWIAAEDEMEAISILRDELFQIEVSEEEMDDVMDDLLVKEILKDEADSIRVLDDCGYEEQSLWDVFQVTFESGLLYSDYIRDDDFDDFDEEFEGLDGDMPEDWY